MSEVESSPVVGARASRRFFGRSTAAAAAASSSGVGRRQKTHKHQP